MSRVRRSFYARGTVAVARGLLGRILCHDGPEGFVAGRIVEVEAYAGAGDPGSHAHRGRTPSNDVMFGQPGRLYVYFTYGMHFCANVVAEQDGVAGAVLLRAVEPIAGLDLMILRRGTGAPRLVASGPARLCKAFGIDRRHNGADLVTGPIWIEGRALLRGPVVSSPRIGLREGAEALLRFYEAGPWASRGRHAVLPGAARGPAAGEGGSRPPRQDGAGRARASP